MSTISLLHPLNSVFFATAYIIFFRLDVHTCAAAAVFDRFDLPEERAIVSLLVDRGYAVVAPASKNRQSG